MPSRPQDIPENRGAEARARNAGQPDGPASVSAAALVAAVTEAKTAQEFLGLLNELRESLGLSYTKIGKRGGKGMSRSTAQAMLKRDDLPPRRHVQLFLRACKVSATDYSVWISTYDQLAGLGQIPVPAPPVRTTDVPEQAVLARQQPVPEQPAREQSTHEQVADRAPATALPQVRGAARTAQTHSILSLTVLLAVLAGCTTTMWLCGVPKDLILLVLAVVLIATFCWTAVMRTAAEAGTPPQTVEDKQGRPASTTDRSDGFFKPPYQ